MVTSFMGSLLWPRRARKAARPGVYGGNGGGSSIEQLSRLWVYRKRGPGAAQGVHNGAGSVDFRPFERTEVVVLLRLGNGGTGVRGVLRAPADAGDSGRQIGGEEQALHGNFGGLRRFGERIALLRRREHRVDDRRMSGGNNAARLVGNRCINARGDVRRVSRHGELFGLAGA